jgi:5'-nucleotidase
LKKHILITNDDGYEAHGLKALINALKDIAKITVVAPSLNKSACGHSLTLTRPLRFIQADDDFYKLDDGTPTDCVHLALDVLFKDEYKPDLIISGINIGANMGEDITYSGTASAAMEGVLHGVPSIAISQVCKDRCQDINSQWDYELATDAIRDIAIKVLDGGFPLDSRKFLNINIPPIKKRDSKGYKITRAGRRTYSISPVTNRNPRGEEYHWIGLHPLAWEDVEVLCDFDAVHDNFVSITPVHLDMTSYKDMDKLSNWFLNQSSMIK